MPESDAAKVSGVFRAFMTPSGYQRRAQAYTTACDAVVPSADGSIIGSCEYYCRPLGCAHPQTVSKMSRASLWQVTKAFATSWDPWADGDLVHRLLHRREALIPPKCTDSDWSRHGSFIVRHIGCGHKPPAYYVSYGYYYCSYFGAELLPELSAAGKEWLDNARWQLQKYMEDGLSKDMKGSEITITGKLRSSGSFSMGVPQYTLELNEEIFKAFAFDTHPIAYLDAGLAYLPSSDIIRILQQPRLQEWIDLATIKQAAVTELSVAAIRAEDYVNESSAEVYDLIDRALGVLTKK